MDFVVAHIGCGEGLDLCHLGEEAASIPSDDSAAYILCRSVAPLSEAEHLLGFGHPLARRTRG